jgi:hypothetical protein
MMKLASRIVLLLIFLGGVFQVSEVSGGADDVAKFEKEYPAAARAIVAKLRQVKGNCRLTQQNTGQSESASTGSFATDQVREKLSVMIKRPPRSEETELIFCIDEDFKKSFNLSRAPKATTYRVEGVGVQGLREVYSELFGVFLCAPYAVVNQELTKVMADSTFHITSARTIQFKERECVEITYEKGEAANKETATVTLDPEAGWVIRKSEHRPTVPVGWVTTTEVDYDLGTGIPPVQTKVLITTKAFKRGCEFNNLSFLPTPVDEFSMDYFKLPDITKPAVPASNNAVYWMGGIGVLGLIFSFLLMRIVARRSSTKGPAK